MLIALLKTTATASTTAKATTPVVTRLVAIRHALAKSFPILATALLFHLRQLALLMPTTFPHPLPSPVQLASLPPVATLVASTLPLNTATLLSPNARTMLTKTPTASHQVPIAPTILPAPTLISSLKLEA